MWKVCLGEYNSLMCHFETYFGLFWPQKYGSMPEAGLCEYPPLSRPKDSLLTKASPLTKAGAKGYATVLSAAQLIQD